LYWGKWLAEPVNGGLRGKPLSFFHQREATIIRSHVEFAEPLAVAAMVGCAAASLFLFPAG
jgi:hypothetical protein